MEGQAFIFVDSYWRLVGLQGCLRNGLKHNVNPLDNVLNIQSTPMRTKDKRINKNSPNSERQMGFCHLLLKESNGLKMECLVLLTKTSKNHHASEERKSKPCMVGRVQGIGAACVLLVGTSIGASLEGNSAIRFQSLKMFQSL